MNENNLSLPADDFFAREMKALKELYIQKFPEKLTLFQQLLCDLEGPSAGEKAIFEVYRFVHSLKGSAGTYGFPNLSAFCLNLEKSLGWIREHNLPVNQKLMDVLQFWLKTLEGQLEALSIKDLDEKELEEPLKRLEAFWESVRA